MHDQLQIEQDRLVAESERHTRAERRSMSVTVQLVLVNVAFALAPAVTSDQSIFGQLTVWRSMALMAPSLMLFAANVILYRVIDPDGAVYRGCEGAEIFLLYANQLTFIFAGSLRWSPLWALCPFAAVVFATTQPFARRFYLAMFALAHGSLAAAQIAAGRPIDALVAVGFGVSAWATYELIAAVQRPAVLVVADRNVAQLELSLRKVDLERTTIAESLAEQISERLSGLIGSMQGIPDVDLATAIDQARAAHRETALIATRSHDAVLPRTLDALASALELKLLPLCVNARLELSRSGELAASLEPATALALLRIGQELVRNAITHGGAKQLDVTLARDATHVTLSVRDDGEGLKVERFNRAVGGLRNARRWAEEQGGTFHRIEQTVGAELKVALPVSRTFQKRTGKI